MRFTESWYAEITPNWNQPYMRQCFAHLKKCLEPVYATNFVCHIACTWESLLFQPPLPVVWVNVYILHSGTWCMFPRDMYTVNTLIQASLSVPNKPVSRRPRDATNMLVWRWIQYWRRENAFLRAIRELFY